MCPRGSNGSAQTRIDVCTLADLLAAHDDPHAAFAAYEAERRPATAETVRTNRVIPPDSINLKVEELVDDRPFDDVDDRAAEPAQRARGRALKPFSARDAAKLVALLQRFVDAFNEQTRAPIRAAGGEKPTKPPLRS